MLFEQATLACIKVLRAAVWDAAGLCGSKAWVVVAMADVSKACAIGDMVDAIEVAGEKQPCTSTAKPKRGVLAGGGCDGSRLISPRW